MMKEADYFALPCVSVDSLLNDFHITDGTYRQPVYETPCRSPQGYLFPRSYFSGTKVLLTTIRQKKGVRHFTFEVREVM